MIPSSLKGKAFCCLTFVNAGLSSFFLAANMEEQAMISGVTAFLCVAVWIAELKVSGEE
tara:strand:+ start:341 stop:517 length:177 start_codon:yes stop_codon:yes gene_type:complete